MLFIRHGNQEAHIMAKTPCPGSKIRSKGKGRGLGKGKGKGPVEKPYENRKVG